MLTLIFVKMFNYFKKDLKQKKNIFLFSSEHNIDLITFLFGRNQ